MLSRISLISHFSLSCAGVLYVLARVLMTLFEALETSGATDATGDSFNDVERSFFSKAVRKLRGACKKYSNRK